MWAPGLLQLGEGAAYQYQGGTEKAEAGSLPKCTVGGETVILNLKEGRSRVGRRTKNFTLRTVR